MDIFSHGYPGRFSFGENMPDDEALSVGAAQIQSWGSVENKTFGNDPKTGEEPTICSYACRTAVTSADFNLAKGLAEETGALVLAYKRRSNYGATFGSSPISASKLNYAFAGYWGLASVSPVDATKLRAMNDPAYRKTIDGGLWDSRGPFGEVRDGATPTDQPTGTYYFKKDN